MDRPQVLEARLGKRALQWVQVGPPALEHLPEYRLQRIKGRVAHFGVEDCTSPAAVVDRKCLPTLKSLQATGFREPH